MGKPLDKSHKVWYNIREVKRAVETTIRTAVLMKETSPKKISKKFEIPLDRLHKVWYNEYVIKRSHLFKKQKGIDTMANRVVFPFTQNQAFSALISLIETGEAKYESTDKSGETSIVKPDPATLVEFLQHRIEQNAKKSDAPRKLTPQQEKNEQTKQGILANMEVGVRYSIGDMLMQFDCFDAGTSPQRVSALLSQMGAKGTGEIVRTEEKGKAYFSLA